MNAKILSCPEDRVMAVSLTSVYYSLSISPSLAIPRPWGRGMT